MIRGGAERDMKKIINQIVESNDKRKQIEHYADYRNYMNGETFDQDVLNRAKFSRQSGYNSAEVQIPYMSTIFYCLPCL